MFTYMSQGDGWVAGWNMPGYLPEMEPAIFDTEEEAFNFIAEARMSFYDDMGQYYDDPYVYWVEPYLGDDDAA